VAKRLGVSHHAVSRIQQALLARIAAALESGA
jgi:DNA-directed RNA polymerase specialized sigma subunit